MRGPTDKLIFAWEKSDSAHGRDGVWLENDDEFREYMRELYRCGSWPRSKIQQGDFRTRELEAHRGTAGLECRLATAKLYLWKGVPQTNDKVGQVYFNFVVSGSRPVFERGIRALIRYVSTLIREVLIDRIYHTNLPSVHWAPERLLREFNLAFDRDLGSSQDAVLQLERQVAKIIREAALSITENYSGYADFVLLIGERLGRAFDGGSGQGPPKTKLIDLNSIGGLCTSGKRYFVGSNVRFTSNDKPDSEADTEDESHFAGYPLEFDDVLARSVMVVPVVHEGEVRALIRLASPQTSCFLDQQARAMQSLEQFARYSILRLDEYKQRVQMSAALDFYTSRMQLPSTGDAALLMQGVLSALGAELGVFWPIERLNPDGTGRFSNGLMFGLGKADEAVKTDDSRYGIRQGVGLTQALIARNASPDTNSFFSLHVLRQESGEGGTTHSDYYLQVFTQAEPEGADQWIGLSDGFYRCAVTDADALFGQGPLQLNPNMPHGEYTCIAFVVWDERTPRAVVWLKFPGLHEVAWWERRYIAGLSISLGKLLQFRDLDFAISSFRHMIPNLTTDAMNALHPLEQQTIDEGAKAALNYLDTYLLTVLWKTEEVRSLLHRVEKQDGGAKEYDFAGARPLNELIDRAIAVAIGFGGDRTPWKPIYDASVSETESISWVFYSALVNLAVNVVLWGWRGTKEEDRLAVIWVRKKAGRYCAAIGNTGQPIEHDPLSQATALARGGQEHGIGLPFVKTLLERHGGDIAYLPGDELRAKYPRAPEDLRRCETVFEFSIEAS